MSLTRDLRQWREDRNITKADYMVFIANILEEIMEPLYPKEDIKRFQKEIMDKYFFSGNYGLIANELDIVDCLQDIIVFSTNEVELMGYDNERCNVEVLKEINSREQNPIQKEQWEKFGTYGKWEKSLLPEHKEKWYKANYESCRL